MPLEEVSLREYVEKILDEREKRFDNKLHAQNEAIFKVEKEFSTMLEGFPQEYAQVSAVDSLRTILDAIRADHVQRREIEELKVTQNQAAGRRSITSVLATFAVSVGLVTAGFLFTDRTNLSNKIQELEVQDQKAQVQISILQTKLSEQQKP